MSTPATPPASGATAPTPQPQPVVPAAQDPNEIDDMMIIFADDPPPEITPAPETPPSDGTPPASGETPPEENPQPDPAPAPENPAAPAAPAVKVTRGAAAPLTQDQLDAALARLVASAGARAATPEAPAAPAAPAKPAQEDLSWLSDEQREEYELLTYAGTADPAMAGKASALLAGYKRVDEYVKRRAAEGDSVTNPSSDQELVAFIAANVPKPSPAELRRLERQRTIDEAKAVANQKAEATLAEARRLAHIAKVAPVIVREVDEFAKGIDADLPKGSPLEQDVSKEVLAHFTSLADQYILVYESVEETTPDIREIADFVSRREDQFIAAGKGLVRDGKTFVKLSQLATMTPAQARNVWAFGKREVLEHLKAAAIAKTKKIVQEREAWAVRMGFQKATPAAGAPKQNHQPTPPPPPKPIESPHTGMSAAPGAVPGKIPVVDTEHAEFVDALSMRK